MDTHLKRKLAMVAIGVTGMTGIGVAATGIASAQSTSTPATQQPSASEAPGTEAADTGAPGVEAAGTEAAGEPTDAAMIAQGLTPHADAAGQNVDHQFNGVE